MSETCQHIDDEVFPEDGDQFGRFVCGLPLEPWPGPCVTCGHPKLPGHHIGFSGLPACEECWNGQDFDLPRHAYDPPKRCTVHGRYRAKLEAAWNDLIRAVRAESAERERALREALVTIQALDARVFPPEVSLETQYVILYDARDPDDVVAHYRRVAGGAGGGAMSFSGSCARKKRFSNGASASVRARELGMRVYRCQWCGGWHLTSDLKQESVPRVSGGSWRKSRKRWESKKAAP